MDFLEILGGFPALLQLIIQIMKRSIFMTALAVAVLASCNRVDLPQSQLARLDIQVQTGITTRGVITENTLPSGSSIGLFVTDDSGVTYNGMPMNNIQYTGTGEGSSQIWSTDEDIMLSGTNATLKGYYPFADDVTDITAIAVEATTDVQTDWMYATPVTELNNKNFTTVLSMNHALAAVRLNLIRDSYNGVGEITSVSITSEGAATNAVFNATDGTLGSITGTGATYTSNEAFSLTAEKKTIEFITVPAGVSAPISLSVMMNGAEIVAEIPAVTLQPGKIYNYTVAVGTSALSLQKMNVVEWNVVDKGTLQPEPFVITIPDPYEEWARIQHVDGTLYTAEEWLAAKSAGTVTNADANGVAVLYSKYAVCPHVIHPKYSTDCPKWSSNTSVEVPDLPNTLDKATAQLDVNGKANTEAILAAVIAGAIEDAPAAQYCADVTFANGQKGYLPAAGELQAWYDNKTAVNACMNAIWGSSVDSKNSWSSTQLSAKYAWDWSKDGHSLGNNSKSGTDYYVRPVVAFSL